MRPRIILNTMTNLWSMFDQLFLTRVNIVKDDEEYFFEDDVDADVIDEETTTNTGNSGNSSNTNNMGNANKPNNKYGVFNGDEVYLEFLDSLSDLLFEFIRVTFLHCSAVFENDPQLFNEIVDSLFNVGHLYLRVKYSNQVPVHNLTRFLLPLYEDIKYLLVQRMNQWIQMNMTNRSVLRFLYNLPVNLDRPRSAPFLQDDAKKKVVFY